MDGYSIKALDETTWDDFAAMVERNSGLFSGCWCTWFHRQDREQDEDNRPYKERMVRDGVAHAALVFHGEEAGFVDDRAKGKNHCVMTKTVEAVRRWSASWSQLGANSHRVTSPPVQRVWRRHDRVATATPLVFSGPDTGLWPTAERPRGV